MVTETSVSQSVIVSVPLICTEHQQDQNLSLSECVVSGPRYRPVLTLLCDIDWFSAASSGMHVQHVVSGFI